jgi:Uma2 family endonuclease
LIGHRLDHTRRLAANWQPKLGLSSPRSSTRGSFPAPVSFIRLPDTATARRPDIVVLDELALLDEPLWEREPVITQGRSIKLVVEVVSTNWETDYARKVEEYAILGIPEFWIADYRGLGGIAFIGKPKQPTFTVCQLVGDEYVQQQYRLGQAIRSPLFPNLQLRLDDVLPR